MKLTFELMKLMREIERMKMMMTPERMIMVPEVTEKEEAAEALPPSPDPDAAESKTEA